MRNIRYRCCASPQTWNHRRVVQVSNPHCLSGLADRYKLCDQQTSNERGRQVKGRCVEPRLGSRESGVLSLPTIPRWLRKDRPDLWRLAQGRTGPAGQSRPASPTTAASREGAAALLASRMRGNSMNGQHGEAPDRPAELKAIPKRAGHHGEFGEEQARPSRLSTLLRLGR